MPTKTCPVPAYVFCDYCWDPGTHTVGEMELCVKTRKAEDEAIKKCKEEEATRLKKEIQHKWEELEGRKHHEALEHKKRQQQQRDVEVHVKCTYCTSGELHTQREVIRCLEAYVKRSKERDALNRFYTLFTLLNTLYQKTFRLVGVLGFISVLSVFFWKIYSSSLCERQLYFTRLFVLFVILLLSLAMDGFNRLPNW